MADFNAANRGVYIADNLDFLRRLNTECVDLVCIDPPFAKNETFTGDRLTPPLNKQEKDIETRLLKRWGVTDADTAEAAGISWPDTEKVGGGVCRYLVMGEGHPRRLDGGTRVIFPL